MQCARLGSSPEGWGQGGPQVRDRSERAVCCFLLYKLKYTLQKKTCKIAHGAIMASFSTVVTPSRLVCARLYL